MGIRAMAKRATKLVGCLWVLGLMSYVRSLPERDDCRGDCLAYHAMPLDPISDNVPLAHMRHSYSTRDKPSLSVDMISVMVNEASTLKANAPAQAGYSQS